jgi:hypothetical protein
MTRADQYSPSIRILDQPAAEVLIVGVVPPLIESAHADLLTNADTGREALGMLKLLRFRLLLANLDVPDMPPWELFARARRAQARLQCALVDDRLILDDERRIRQTGAAVFGTNDPALSETVARLLPRTSTWRPLSRQAPDRAPP